MFTMSTFWLVMSLVILIISLMGTVYLGKKQNAAENQDYDNRRVKNLVLLSVLYVVFIIILTLLVLFYLGYFAD